MFIINFFDFWKSAGQLLYIDELRGYAELLVFFVKTKNVTQIRSYSPPCVKEHFWMVNMVLEPSNKERDISLFISIHCVTYCYNLHFKHIFEIFGMFGNFCPYLPGKKL